MILKYKNKFKLILDLLFNYDKVEKKQDELVDNIIYKLSKLSKEDKANLVKTESSEIDILYCPIYNKDSISISKRKHSVNVIDSSIPVVENLDDLDNIEEIVSGSISKRLIENGILQRKIEKDKITFYVQYFK